MQGPALYPAEVLAVCALSCMCSWIGAGVDDCVLWIKLTGTT